MDYIKMLLDKAKRDREQRIEYLKKDIEVQEEVLESAKRDLSNSVNQLKQINEALNSR
jgi:hypothetical protein